MKTILLTGANGKVGTSLQNYLGRLYHFRCLDIKEDRKEADSVVASTRDFKAVAAAMQGVDAAIHLAIEPNSDQTRGETFLAGIEGTYNVFEAARRSGILKIIFASSTAVLGWNEMQQGNRLYSGRLMQPRSLYGVGKATGELLARHFSETYGMSIICLRIGSFHVDPPSPESLQDDILKSWCSPADLAQLVHRCIESEKPGFQVYYGVSDNKRRLWDIENARKLVGFQPGNDAEDLVRQPGEKERREIAAPEHNLLMRAAVMEGEAAFKSWEGWLEKVDLETADLDSITYRLLPLVYYNLAGQCADPPLMARLKGIYRRSWLENQLCLQQVIPILSQIKERGISVLLIGDLASLLSLYDGQGTRRIYSLDLLVRPADVPKLLAFFQERGNWPKVPYGERFLKVETPLSIWPPFDMPLTVGWRPHPEVKSAEQAEVFWQQALPASLGNLPVFTLDLESHFLRSCLRASGSPPEVALFALVDAAWLLKEQHARLDWEKVLELTRSNHQVAPVLACLREIYRQLEIPQADKLAKQMEKIPVTWVDTLEYRLVYSSGPFPRPIARAVRRLLLYRRSIKIAGLAGLLRYFQYVWGGGRLIALPRLAVRHAWGALTGSRRVD